MQNCVEVSLCDLFANRVLYGKEKKWFCLLSIYSHQNICIVWFNNYLYVVLKWIIFIKKPEHVSDVVLAYLLYLVLCVCERVSLWGCVACVCIGVLGYRATRGPSDLPSDLQISTLSKKTTCFDTVAIQCVLPAEKQQVNTCITCWFAESTSSAGSDSGRHNLFWRIKTP